MADRAGEKKQGRIALSVELIGLIILGLGGAAILWSSAAAFTVMLCASLLMAASAVFIGGSNIQPGHLSIGLFFAAIAIRKSGLSAMLKAVSPAQPGFWLLLCLIWGVMSAFVMPRLFFEAFTVYPPDEINAFGQIIERPLVPRGSNITQTIYLFGNMLAFAAAAAFARNHDAMRSVAVAVLIAGMMNLFFALLDVVTHEIGMTHLLSFIRNATYAQGFAHEVFGMKRITGSYPEASTYAYVTTGLFAFLLRLWRGGIDLPFLLPVTGALFVTLLLSTSTTAYVALAAYLCAVYGRQLTGSDRTLPLTRKGTSRQGALISLLPFAVFAVVTVIALKPDLLDPVNEFFTEGVANKLQSQSGMERSRWNAGGVEALVNTFGLGAGMGSVRASSLVISLLANLGLLGSAFFFIFMARVFTYDTMKPRLAGPLAESQQIAAAARSGAFAIFIALTISGTMPDPGIQFSVFAGVASGLVFQRERESRARPEGYVMPEFDEPDGSPVMARGAS
jgi:hypothetical protein